MIGVIGRRDEVAGFALCGAICVGTDDAIEAALALRRFIGRVRLLIITEEFAEALRKDIEEIEEHPDAPIIVEIPGRYMRSERDRIKEIVKKAIGVEIRGE